MSNLYKQSLLDARSGLERGDYTAEQLCQQSLDRIDATENRLGALVCVQHASALKKAKELDAKGFDASKLLWGIPVTIKDCLATKGIKTTAGSKILENFIPPYDAFVVEKLQNAGAIILGKNNMDEFAMGSTCENSAWKKTHNPWDITRVPGGSSGGSAAAVAACQSFAALGTDTGGSIRQPASLTSCVGLKPTYGAVSRYGLIAYGSSLDQIGPLTRTVQDAAMIFSVIAGNDPRDTTSAPWQPPTFAEYDFTKSDLNGVCIGLPKEFYNVAGLDPEVASLCQNAINKAKELGATIKEVSMPHLPYSIAAYYIIASAEASSNLARYDGVRYTHRTKKAMDLDELYTKSRTEGFGQEVQRRILLGTYVLCSGYYDAYYRKAAQVRRLIQQDYENALQECDFLLAPVSPITAWKHGEVSNPLAMYQLDVFTLSLNLAGLPGLALPVGFAQGLPVGMQLMGKAFDEKHMLEVGACLENSLGIKDTLAPL